MPSCLVRILLGEQPCTETNTGGTWKLDSRLVFKRGVSESGTVSRVYLTNYSLREVEMTQQKKMRSHIRYNLKIKAEFIACNTATITVTSGVLLRLLTRKSKYPLNFSLCKILRLTLPTAGVEMQLDTGLRMWMTSWRKANEHLTMDASSTCQGNPKVRRPT